MFKILFTFVNLKKLKPWCILDGKKIECLLINIKETNTTTGPRENQSLVKKRPFCPRVKLLAVSNFSNQL